MINTNMAPLEEVATSPGTLGTGTVGIRIRSGGPQCPPLRRDDRGELPKCAPVLWDVSHPSQACSEAQEGARASSSVPSPCPQGLVSAPRARPRWARRGGPAPWPPLPLGAAVFVLLAEPRYQLATHTGSPVWDCPSPA